MRSSLFFLACGLAAATDAAAAAQNCAETGTCSADMKPTCQDDDARCKKWSESGECSANPNYMSKGCRKSCYLCCDDTHEQCESWAKAGECDANPGYMNLGCPQSCGTCKMLDKRARCKEGINLESTLHNFSMTQMFERLVDTDMFAQYKPKALSRDPWVVFIEDLVPPDAIDDLLDAFKESGNEFAASSELDLPEGEGAITKRRSSESMFCASKACWSDPRVQRIHDIAGNITGLPSDNMEYMQVVRYSKGQYYVKHHDTSATYGRSLNGHRIYTMFLYLTDELPEGGGGETAFPDLTQFGEGGLKVRVKKGAAALWANVDPLHPEREDFRTMHEALPLEFDDSMKMGANLWQYALPWRKLMERNCINTIVD